MNENRIAKKAQVDEILGKVKAASAIVIVEYAGLTVKETQELKAQLKEAGVEMKVYKNRLVKIALEEAGLGDLATGLVGPNAFVFGSENDIAPAKILAKFAKDHDALKLKAGTYEGNVIDAEGVAQIATLPSLEEALTMLASSMLAPVTQVGKGLFMLVDEGHLGKDETATVEAPEAPAAEVKEETTEPAKEPVDAPAE